jgi:hypothetical protein
MMMMPQPGFAPTFPGGGMPPGFARPQPFAAPGRPPAPLPQQPPPYPGLAQPQPSPRPAPPPSVIRGQAPDEPLPPPPAPAPRPAPLRLPTPEELGLASRPSVAPIASATAHERLDQLGATSLLLEKLPQGGCRLTCRLATAHEGRFHRIDVQAATPAEALALALQKAESWAARR